MINKVTNIVLAAAAVAAMVLYFPAPAGADPTPAPPGPYQIISPSGPQIGGLPNYPAVCAAQPRACNLTWNPNSGAWTAPSGTGSP
jgi:hypothetical protein